MMRCGWLREQDTVGHVARGGLLAFHLWRVSPNASTDLSFCFPLLAFQ